MRLIRDAIAYLRRTTMSDVTKYYENRQKGYTDRYVFQFRTESAGYLTIRCLEHPDDPFGEGESHHHLHDNGKLCQRQGFESRTFEHAEAFSHWWMKRFSIYVRTGT